MAALEHSALAQYQARLCERLFALYPEEAGALGAAGVATLVADGQAQAASYDIDSERDVALFVDLMLFLGAGFDSDPGLPWAAEILSDELILDPGLRIDTLHARAVAHLNGEA
jgi:hypothetical protein